MTASACSKTAFATSVISARVGIGLVIIDSSMCVATTTGLPKRMQCFTIRRWMMGSSSIGISMPRSPRAIMTASAAAIISSICLTADWSSILTTIKALLFFCARKSRSSSRSLFCRAKLSPTKSTPSWTPSVRSTISFLVNGGRFTCTPGRLMWRREPSFPGVITLHRTRFFPCSMTMSLIRPLSTRTVSPPDTSLTNPS